LQSIRGASSQLSALDLLDISIRSREPMPRYYFHYRDGSSLFEDEIGEMFADAAQALQHAKRIALELTRGGEPINAAITVAQGDQQLSTVPLSLPE
jgi:hypothetical protein